MRRPTKFGDIDLLAHTSRRSGDEGGDAVQPTEYVCRKGMPPVGVHIRMYREPVAMRQQSSIKNGSYPSGIQIGHCTADYFYFWSLVANYLCGADNQFHILARISGTPT